MNERTKLIIQTIENEQEQQEHPLQQPEQHPSLFVHLPKEKDHLPIITTTTTTTTTTNRNNENSVMTNNNMMLFQTVTTKWKTRYFILNFIWFLYFLSTVIVIMIGIYHNQNPVRKYILVPNYQYQQHQQQEYTKAMRTTSPEEKQQSNEGIVSGVCQKLFINVFTTPTKKLENTTFYSTIIHNNSMICCRSIPVMDHLRTIVATSTTTTTEVFDQDESSSSLLQQHLCSIALKSSSLTECMIRNKQQHGQQHQQQQNTINDNFLSLFYGCINSTNLPFASRLAKFPDAWLLPLVPLLLRMMIWICMYPVQNSIRFIVYLLFGYGVSNYHRQSTTTTTGNVTNPNNTINNTSSSKSEHQHRHHRHHYHLHNPIVYYVRRFFLYILIMFFRGYFLYVGLNKFEKYLLQHIRSHNHNNDCWYSKYLTVKQQLQQKQQFDDNHNSSKCYGQEFDFSDHMVLYYGQILPIALIETIHSIKKCLHRSSSSTSHSYSSPTTSQRRSGTTYDSRTKSLVRIDSMVMVFTILYYLYLHLITSMGSYHTTLYFHTGTEIMIGYLMSCCFIVIPLWQLQCNTTQPWILSCRQFFYGERKL